MFVQSLVLAEFNRRSHSPPLKEEQGQEDFEYIVDVKIVSDAQNCGHSNCQN